MAPTQQPARHGDDNLHSGLHSKLTKPVSILVMLLLGVVMSVSNIRNAVQMLPGAIDNDVLGTITSSTGEESIGNSSPHLNTAENKTVADDTATLDLSTSELSTALSASTPESSTTTLSTPKSILSELPDDNNTVISIVAMGPLVNGYLVERCIRSIRRRGLFYGDILVFTDKIGHDRYQKSVLPWDQRTRIIIGWDEDMTPKDPVTETPRQYAQETMIFKRFKTHHSKYITDDVDLGNSIRFVIYLDVDNLIGAPLSIFFREYSDNVASEYQRAFNEQRKRKQNSTAAVESAGVEATTDEDENHDRFGFISMFRDSHLRGKFHSGIIVFDRQFEERCVNGWRNEMDTFYDRSDQTMFVRVLENYDRYHCVAFELPRQFMSFATKRMMVDAMEVRQKIRKKRKPLVLPTVIHVTNFRVRRLNNNAIHDDFVRYVLDLKDNEYITNGTSWEDAVPHNAKRVDTSG
eukprot:jgi/Psemu1/291400/fgenesh1_pg.692_\